MLKIINKIKIYIVISLIIIAVILYFVGKTAYLKYQWMLEKLEKVETLERWKDSIDIRKLIELNKIDSSVKKSRQSKSMINQKLKEDEKTIDSAIYTDKQRQRFLSRFED